MAHRSAMLAVVLVVALAGSAAAQPQAAQPTPHQALGAAVQWAYPYDGGFLNGTPGVNLSYQWWFGKHLGVEAAFGWWRKDLSRVFNGPGMDGSVRNQASFYSLGGNILGRVPLGRAALIAGGGPGIFAERAHIEGRFNDQTFDDSSSRSHFGVQTMAELEVAATDRIAIFGGVRFEIRDIMNWELDSSAAYPEVGVRVRW